MPQPEISDLLAKNPDLGTEEIARRLDANPRTILKELGRLKNKQIVTYERLPNHMCVWRLLPGGY